MLEEGKKLAEKYRIDELVGKGGMGSVYRAEDLCDHTIWAVKEERISRSNEQLLRQESAILLKLNHPLLPKAREIFEINEYLYIVMEFVRGQTLQSILNENGKVPESVAWKWFQQISDVLAYLHGLDTPIVYRDLKPSNIMIQPSGDIKLIDFGLAEEYRTNKRQGKKILALTRGYAAPEQYDGRYRDDVRTDIYALGVTMHYAVTGKNPNKPPFRFRPVRKLNSSVSYAMEYIIGKCIQPSPDKRYANACELSRELQNMQSLEKRMKVKRRNRYVAGILAGLAVTGILFGIFMLVNAERNKTVAAYYRYVEQAEVCEKAREYDEAVLLYETAIEMQPKEWKAYIGKAEIYYQQGKYEKCLEWMKETAQQFPDIFEVEEFRCIMEQLYEDGNVYEEDR